MKNSVEKQLNIIGSMCEGGNLTDDFYRMATGPAKPTWKEEAVATEVVKPKKPMGLYLVGIGAAIIVAAALLK